MIYLGNGKLDSLYLGATKISEIYLGSTKIFSLAPVGQYPYLLFQCDGYNGGHPDVSQYWRGQCIWTQVSLSPNIWKLEITRWGYAETLGHGLLFLFGNQNDMPGSIQNSCSLIGSGNMDMALDGEYCESMDRMFTKCTGLGYIEPIHCTTVQNVGGMFSGCTNVQEGALAQYNWFNTYGVNINNHSGTFTNCGSNTPNGAAELDQIPVGWGGNLVPASTLMTSSRITPLGTYSAWEITGNEPDWANIVGLYLFTQASVSRFAGVSMNRSRITKLNGLDISGALYFYPAFAQMSNRTLTWVATTDTPNGNLTSGQGNTDMPGTLDYSTYGPITRTYGTYDSSGYVLFLFLVTSTPVDDDALSSWGGLNDPYGVLYNQYYNTDGGFRYFF